MSPVSRSATDQLTSALRQEIAELAGLPSVHSAMEWLRNQEPEFAEWQIELAAIPAPPFGEAARSKWLEAKFKKIGLKEVTQDLLGNVLGVSAPDQGGILSVSAHLDTVFPADSPLQVRQEGRRLYGPGVSDNAAGVTALLAVASAFQRFKIPHRLPVLFIGNVGEEGEGNLRGIRHLFTESEYKDRIVASVIIDGAGTDTIIADALGSRRFEIVIRGPGGHSWTDFGMPNPIVALSRAIHFFSQTRVPSSPKTSFNVGVIAGGTSVNSIPESASMRVDIRSTSGFEIERLELELRRAVEQAVEDEQNRSSGRARSPDVESELEFEVRIIGSRPAGELDRKARILQAARAVDAYLGNSSQIQRASTDANIPISLGREAIAIGAGGRGGGAHTLQEWFDPAARELGLRRILLLILAVSTLKPIGAQE